MNNWTGGRYTCPPGGEDGSRSAECYSLEKNRVQRKTGIRGVILDDKRRSSVSAVLITSFRDKGIITNDKLEFIIFM